MTPTKLSKADGVNGMTEKAGQWRLSSVSPALVISSGLVFLRGKKPKGLTLEDVLEMIKKHPGKGYYERSVTRRVTLGDALVGEFADLGKEKEMFSSIDLYQAQHDREFSKVPETGRQLLGNHYKSKPRTVLLNDKS